ncbi:O-antigen ligase family protein [Patescibacteria group bacterium]|nr:O-antigen ligase family protein [Patescibacteria group bacterium]
MKFFRKLLEILFYLLFFLIPIVLWPFSYELFEFNKIIVIYILTLLIAFCWVSKSLVKRRLIFRRTILDTPLIIFLTVQLLSTLVSIDTRTSIFGYYSRFNGGFLSLISFALLYWAFVSNIDSKKAVNSIKALIFSSLLVCIYGILEHFGIDKELWVQDVSERVFSTLGQPNWLAAWIVAIIPLTYVFILKVKNNRIFFGIVSTIIFLTLLYTKSRSGFLGFAISSLIFWVGLYFLKLKNKSQKSENKKILKIFIVINVLFLIINLLVKTPWTPDFSKILNKNNSDQQFLTQPIQTGTVLESGGTESGTIRKFVWQGAINIWKSYPILGSGVETFAFSFYQYRPKEHNLVSEWDFLYNKAHNEYLNFLATTGSLGFLSYISLIVFIILTFIKSIKKDNENRLFHLALLSGFLSILITNFFGFSVAAVNLQFFLYPAISISLTKKEEENDDNNKITSSQKLGMFLLGAVTLFLLNSIIRYWLADLNFAKAKRLNDTGIFTNARENLLKSVKYSSKEAIFWSELSENSADISLLLKEKDDKENSKKLIESAIQEAKTAERLSPNNLSVLRQIVTTYIKLSQIDINFLSYAKDYLEKSIELSPNDAKLYFNLGLIYANSTDTGKAIETLEKAVYLKENYKKARSSLATLYFKENDKDKAKEQLEYILKNIDPKDESIIQRLKDIQTE